MQRPWPVLRMCPLPVCPAPATSRAHILTAEPSKAVSELRWVGGQRAAEAWERGGGEVGGEVIRDRIQRGDRPQIGRASVLSTFPSLLSDLHKTQSSACVLGVQGLPHADFPSSGLSFGR